MTSTWWLRRTCHSKKIKLINVLVKRKLRLNCNQFGLYNLEQLKANPSGILVSEPDSKESVNQIHKSFLSHNSVDHDYLVFYSLSRSRFIAHELLNLTISNCSRLCLWTRKISGADSSSSQNATRLETLQFLSNGKLFGSMKNSQNSPFFDLVLCEDVKSCLVPLNFLHHLPKSPINDWWNFSLKLCRSLVGLSQTPPENENPYSLLGPKIGFTIDGNWAWNCVQKKKKNHPTTTRSFAKGRLGNASNCCRKWWLDFSFPFFSILSSHELAIDI